jgi:hypothetical protein
MASEVVGVVWAVMWACRCAKRVDRVGLKIGGWIAGT